MVEGLWDCGSDCIKNKFYVDLWFSVYKDSISVYQRIVVNDGDDCGDNDDTDGGGGRDDEDNDNDE